MSCIIPGQDVATGEGQAQEWAKGDCPCRAHVPGAPGPAREGGSGWRQDLLHAGCSPVRCHRSYCRDLTMALRAWGVSGTEGDEL